MKRTQNIVNANLFDRVVGYFSPVRAFRNIEARKLLRFSNDGVLGSRLDRYPQQPSRRGKFQGETEYQTALAEKANQITNQNPAAEGIIGRLIEGVVSERIDMVARTDSEEFNAAHLELWDHWSQFDCDARNMDDFTGLVYMIVRGLVVDGRILVYLVNDGSLQLIESPRLRTPPTKHFDTNFVNGVELNAVGAPRNFHVLKDPLKGDSADNYTVIPARDGVYFAMRKTYGDTSGRTVLGESFDNFEQIDATIEAVITAAQVAASYGVIFKGPNTGGTLQSTTRATTDAQGNSTRGFTLEPGTAKYLSDFESMEQMTPEHPSQNLVEFLREVLRFASLPAGVPLELMTMDFTKINYSGARSMNLFFDRVCRVVRARYLHRGLRRIYAWRTSKWLKQDPSPLPKPPERQDWKCVIQYAGLPWVDPVADADADQIMVDRGWESDSEVIRRRGGNPGKVFSQIKADEAARDAAGIEKVWSSKTRHKQDPAAAGGSKDDANSDAK